MAESDAAFRRDQGAKLRSTAENLAATDLIRQGMRTTVWYDSLAAGAETARGVSGSSFVEVTDARGILLTGPHRGQQADLGASDGASGRAWLGVVEHDGIALVAHAPVIDPGDGRVLGLVVVGKTYPSWLELLATATPDLLTYLLLGSLLGVAGSMLLARRVKRQTLGLEPAEIAGLVEHREAMLHGIKEGLIGLDSAGRVTLANDEACRLLGLPGDVTGSPLRLLGVPDEVLSLLTEGSEEPDHVVVHDSRVLVLNRMPVLVRGRKVGSVTTLRDHTELTSLERELDLSRRTTDTLRAQAHEFTTACTPSPGWCSSVSTMRPSRSSSRLGRRRTPSVTRCSPASPIRPWPRCSSPRPASRPSSMSSCASRRTRRCRRPRTTSWRPIW